MSITVQNLSKYFNKSLILNDISFHVPKGNLTALLGQNGSGKSTLMKSILNIIRINKESIIKTSSDIAYMPQSPAFPKHLNVREVIHLFNALNAARPTTSKKKKKNLATPLSDTQKRWQKQLIEEMAIDDFMHKKIHQLSPGMRQKVNILQCFMFQRKIVLLDEPSAGLDLHMLHYLKKLLLAQKNAGITILYTSHIMAEVEALADEMIWLYDGKVALQESPRKIIQQQKAKNLEEALRLWVGTKKNKK